MNIDVDFLRRLRRGKRLSLAEAAALLGKSRSTLWRYENDKVNMSAATLLMASASANTGSGSGNTAKN